MAGSGSAYLYPGWKSDTSVIKEPILQTARFKGILGNVAWKIIWRVEGGCRRIKDPTKAQNLLFFIIFSLNIFEVLSKRYFFEVGLNLIPAVHPSLSWPEFHFYKNVQGNYWIWCEKGWKSWYFSFWLFLLKVVVLCWILLNSEISTAICSFSSQSNERNDISNAYFLGAEPCNCLNQGKHRLPLQFLCCIKKQQIL